MKPYGVKKQDAGCCPGHDKYPPDTYRNRRSKKARSRARHSAHSRARAVQRQQIYYSSIGGEAPTE